MGDGNLYFRLWKMSQTIYAAIFEQTIIHQHVHLRRESQSYAPGHEIIPNRLLARLLTKREKDVILELTLIVRKCMSMNNKAHAG